MKLMASLILAFLAEVSQAYPHSRDVEIKRMDINMKPLGGMARHGDSVLDEVAKKINEVIATEGYHNPGRLSVKAKVAVSNYLSYVQDRNPNVRSFDISTLAEAVSKRPETLLTLNFLIDNSDSKGISLVERFAIENSEKELAALNRLFTLSGSSGRAAFAAKMTISYLEKNNDISLLRAMRLSGYKAEQVDPLFSCQ